MDAGFKCIINLHFITDGGECVNVNVWMESSTLSVCPVTSSVAGLSYDDKLTVSHYEKQTNKFYP